MSAYNTNNSYQNQPLHNPKHGELNENHGIAATGLNDPHTATAPFVQGNTGSRRQGNDDLKYSGAPMGGNKLDQSGVGNTAGGLSTSPGGHVNNHHQGLAATGNINESRGGNNYGNNMNDLSTHQPKNDVIHSTTGNDNLNYSGADTDIRHVDQTGGHPDRTDYGTENTHTGLGNTTGTHHGTHTGLGNTTGTHHGTHTGLGNNTGTHTGLGNTTGTHGLHTGTHGTHTGGTTGLNKDNYSGADTNIRNVDQTGGHTNRTDFGTSGTHTGHHGTHTGLGNNTGATVGANEKNLEYTGADANPRYLDQSGDNTRHATNTGVPTNTHTGKTGTSGINTTSHTGHTGTSGITPTSHTGTTTGTTAGLTDNTTRGGHTGTSGDNTESNRHAGTGVPPVMTQTGKKEYDHSTHHHNTAPEGDHGASHHIKRDGGNQAGFDEKARNAIYPTTGTSVPSGTNQRHTGEPLHEGMGKVKHNREYNENDPLTHGNHPVSSDATEKPSAGDKIKGNLEKMAGKITGNEAKVIKGENIAHGRQ